VPGVGYAMPAKVGKYEVLDIMTDNKDDAIAKSNAESALIAHSDISCMVGLWAYNPPAILSALQARSLEGKIKIVGFDEHPATLAGIADGKITGTIAQQPYLFGFKSAEYLAAMARGQKVNVPENKMIYVPYSVITAENIQEFNAGVQAIRDGKGPIPQADAEYDTSKPIKLAFVTNSVDLFWVLAQKGCERADEVLNTKTQVTFPSQGSVDEQKQAIEQAVNNSFDGLAISPINPENQVDMLNEAAEKMSVICQDSDAPKSNRKFYLGTSNYLAGRAAGKLVKQAIPDGGKVMVFVGKLEVLNAQERSKGLIDELGDKPLPPGFESAGN
jgi:ribose transport system substrate-binding protein